MEHVDHPHGCTAATLLRRLTVVLGVTRLK